MLIQIVQHMRHTAARNDRSLIDILDEKMGNDAFNVIKNSCIATHLILNGMQLNLETFQDHREMVDRSRSSLMKSMIQFH